MGHRTQADALAQVVHLVEVLTPLAVEYRQEDLTLELAHRRLTELGLATVIGILGIRLEVLDELLTVLTVGVLVDVETNGVHSADLVPHRLEVPVLGVALGVLAHTGLDDAISGGAQLDLDVGTFENLATVPIDDVTLTVHDVVILQDVLTHLEVLRLNLLLGTLDLTRHPLGLDRHVLGHLEGDHGAVDDLRLEQAHQLVLQGQVEPGLTRVTLTTGTSTQLVVDTARLVTLGTDDVEAAQFLDLLVLGLRLFLVPGQGVVPGGLVGLFILHRVEPLLAKVQLGEEFWVTPQDDVGTTAGHVGRDRHSSLAAGQGDDRRLGLVVLGVQDLVGNAGPFELLREQLRLGDGCGTDKDRLTSLVALDDVGDDGVELGILGAVDEVLLVLADHRAVRRDRDDAQTVDLLELALLGLGGTRHAGELVVHAEIVLQGDRREGLVLVLDLDMFLGLEGLVQTLVVATPCQGTTGVFVDDEDLAIDDNVVLVAVEELLGLDGVVEVTDERSVCRFVQVLDSQTLLDDADAVPQNGHGPLLLVNLVVDVALKPRDDLGEFRVPLLVLLGRAGDDQRGTSLVDEDRANLVDDGEVMATLHALAQGAGHVVAQVVEAELIVRAVGDVGLVCLLALHRRHVRQNRRDRQTQEVVHTTHLLGLHSSQVVVDGDDVDALAEQPLKVGGEKTDEGFALTGLHLGDVALVQGRTAHDLNVEVTLAEYSPGRLTHRREGLRKQPVQVLAVVETLTEVGGLSRQLVVAHGDVVLLDAVDLADNAVESADDLAFTGVQHAIHEVHGVGPSRSRRRVVRAHPGRAAQESCLPHPRGFAAEPRTPRPFVLDT